MCVPRKVAGRARKFGCLAGHPRRTWTVSMRRIFDNSAVDDLFLIASRGGTRDREVRSEVPPNKARMPGRRPWSAPFARTLEPARAGRVDRLCHSTSPGNSFLESASRGWRSRSRGALSLIVRATGPMIPSAIRRHGCCVNMAVSATSARTGRALRRKRRETSTKWRTTNSRGSFGLQGASEEVARHRRDESVRRDQRKSAPQRRLQWRMN